MEKRAKAQIEYRKYHIQLRKELQLFFLRKGKNQSDQEQMAIDYMKIQYNLQGEKTKGICSLNSNSG